MANFRNRDYGLFYSGSGGGGGGSVISVDAVSCTPTELCVVGGPINTTGTFCFYNLAPYSGQAVEVLGAGTCSTYRCCVNNLSSGCYSASLGGQCNSACGNFSGNVAGCCNTTFGNSSFTGSGFYNNTFNNCSFIGGGACNVIRFDSDYSSLVGGLCNSILIITESGSGYSFLGGGKENTVSNTYSSVVGGRCNLANGSYSFIGGGCENTAIGCSSFIGNGHFNTSSSRYNFTGSGYCNTTSGIYGFTGSGYKNVTSGRNSFTGSGYNNTNSGCYTFLGNGVNNTTSSNYSGILGGKCNTTSTFCDTFIIGSCLTATQACTTFVNCISTANIPVGCAVCTTTNNVLVGYSPSVSPVIKICSITSGTSIIDTSTRLGYNAAFYNFTITDCTNSYSGNLVANWNPTTGAIQFTETSTSSIGNTAGVSFSFTITGNNVNLVVTVPTANWKISFTKTVLDDCCTIPYISGSYIITEDGNSPPNENIATEDLPSQEIIDDLGNFLVDNLGNLIATNSILSEKLITE